VNFREFLGAEFRPYGQLSEQQLSALAKHYELLLAWNQRLNLTRVVDLEEAVRFHYCESLFLARTLPPGPLSVADLGSGAGFPGIPVAVLRSDLRVTLIESDSRKAVFLREATRCMDNVEVAMVRFESCGRRFDWVVSRAVAPAEVLASGLAGNFALLASPDSAPGDAQILRLPWGRDRAVIVVSRGTVSRGTSP
jgi:16S rRNA (guanine527-N7)-methyltransferase